MSPNPMGKCCPTISVIVPTYKRADRIERAIESILAQTFTDFEIVVVDDNVPGSVERIETRRRLDCYATTGKLRVVETSGSTGGGSARNYGCRQAKGSMLAFLDDDDEFLPNKLEEQLAFMQKNNLEMSWQDAAWYDERGKLVERRVLDRFESLNKNDLLKAHMLTPLCPTAIYMITKDLFLHTEGFGETKSGQDWFLMLRCIEAGARIGYMSGFYIRQYLHEGERISLGQNKIDGENLLYDYKRKYFSLLTRKEKKYVTFRHFAVLAFACKRSRFYGKALLYAVRTVLASPVNCAKEAKRFLKR